MNRKRSCEAPFAPSKRPVLAPLQNQLATPPTTPNKDSVVDLSSQTRPRLTESVYSKAKALFQRGTSNDAVECLVGRETEAAQLRAFLETSVAKNACNSLYISGPPGTGKTAQTNMTLDWLARQKSGFRLDGKCKLAGRLVKIIRLNCMTVSKPENVFHELYNLATGKVSARKRLFDDFYELL